jgi:hypothetical protein
MKVAAFVLVVLFSPAGLADAFWGDQRIDVVPTTPAFQTILSASRIQSPTGSILFDVYIRVIGNDPIEVRLVRDGKVILFSSSVPDGPFLLHHITPGVAGFYSFHWSDTSPGMHSYTVQVKSYAPSPATSVINRRLTVWR